MAEPLRCNIPAQANHAQLYELLVSELTDFVVFLMDPTGCIMSWNPGVERILGYTEAEWLGRPAHIIFTPEDRAAKKPEEEMTKAARDGRTPDIRWHQRKDGSRLFVEGTMVVLKDDTGQLLGFSKVMRDITERKRAEEELQRARAEAYTILESITDGFATFDREWRVIYVNASAEQLLDMRREEVLGKNHWDLFPETLGTVVEHEYRRAVREGVSVEFELFFEPWQRWMSAKCYPTKDGGLSVYFRDITTQKHADDELRRQWHTFDVLLSHIPDHSYLLDLDGRFVYANKAVLELWRKPLDEVVGQHMAELIVVPEVAELLVRHHRQVITTGQPVRHESLYTPPGGDTYHFEYILTPVFSADGVLKAVAGATRDVTAHKRTVTELERVNRGLEEFAHVSSHDLQEPLRMVNSYSQLLIRRLGHEATDEQQEFAGYIQHGVKRMETLIRDLLAYSRTVHTAGELTVSQTSLEEALHHALTIVEGRIAETGATVTHDALPTVRGDVNQLAHVFQNLLSNALKYRKPNESPCIYIEAEQQGVHWVIIVRDNGIGFEQHQAERIFGLFKRLHREEEYPGTGLGLAICKRIIERYGGKMWAESELGVGSKFFFSLPVVQA